MAGEIDHSQDVRKNHFNFSLNKILECIEQFSTLITHSYHEKHFSTEDSLCEDLSQGGLLDNLLRYTELWNIKWNIR